jgi:membrane fusion protein (multidrug efflux system)
MEKRTTKKRNKKVYIPVILTAGIVLCVAIYYYWQYMKYVTTDDAVVDCNNVALGPKVMGRLVNLYTDEGDSVKAGQVLFELDSTDLKAQQIQAEANVAQLLTNVIQAETKLMAEKENNKVLEINAEKAKNDFDRASKQKEADVITQEQYDNFRKAYLAANAQLAAAQAQLKVTLAQIQSARAAAETGRAQVNVIATQMKNMRICSPFDGVVAKRWLLPGDIVQPGQTVLTLNNDKNLWISAFIEETKLRNIHYNQEALFTIDALPGLTFYGKVYSIGNNTASRFSLIPPTNASGNFTKITQRVQLKISIDSVSRGTTQEYALLTGMSAVIKLKKQ